MGGGFPMFPTIDRPPLDRSRCVYILSLMNTTTTPAAKKFVTCPKCFGAKRIQAFGHIEAGICFTCCGNGTVEIVERAARPMRTVAERERCINYFANLIAAVRSQYATRGEWLDLGFEDDLETVAQIRAWLTKAPADVAARARQALSAAIVCPKVRAAVLATEAA